MSYESPLKRFRDMNKNPDMYPEDSLEKIEIKKMIEDDKQNNVNGSIGIEQEKKEVISSIGKNFKQTVSLLQSAGLLPDFEQDKNEAIIIEQRKETILKLLSTVLKDVENYLAQVNYLQLQRVTSYDSLDKYQEAIGHSDACRRQFHNKLIQDIKIAARLININFNSKYPDELRLEGESKMLDRKGLSSLELEKLMKERCYYEFPCEMGGFIDFTKIPRDPEGERGYIAKWAFGLYSDLTVLQEDLIDAK